MLFYLQCCFLTVFRLIINIQQTSNNESSLIQHLNNQPMWQPLIMGTNLQPLWFFTTCVTYLTRREMKNSVSSLVSTLLLLSLSNLVIMDFIDFSGTFGNFSEAALHASVGDMKPVALGSNFFMMDSNSH